MTEDQAHGRELAAVLGAPFVWVLFMVAAAILRGVAADTVAAVGTLAAYVIVWAAGRARRRRLGGAR
jgi:hypothetical protein